MMDLDALSTGGSIGVLTAIVLLTNAITRWLTRWQVTRSSERKDTLTQTREAYDAAMQRVAKLEGRTDVLQSQLGTAQQALSDERVSNGQRITALTLETEQLRGLTEQLRGRIVQLEQELDEARAENARLRGLAPPSRRSLTPPHPIPAQPDSND